jgi:pyridoxine 4-dehydrogenase
VMFRDCSWWIPLSGAPRRCGQTEDNLGALALKLTAADVAALEDAAREAPRTMIQNVFQTK